MTNRGMTHARMRAIANGTAHTHANLPPTPMQLPTDGSTTLMDRVIETIDTRAVNEALRVYRDRMTAKEIAWVQSAPPAEAMQYIKQIVRARRPGQKPLPSFDARDEAEMDRQMGMSSASAPKLPRKLPDGRFVMHNVRPSDLRRLDAVKAKKSA